MNTPKKPTNFLGDEALDLSQNKRELGDLGLFAGEYFENDFRRVDDALSLLNGNVESIEPLDRTCLDQAKDSVTEKPLLQ